MDADLAGALIDQQCRDGLVCSMVNSLDHLREGEKVRVSKGMITSATEPPPPVTATTTPFLRTSGRGLSERAQVVWDWTLGRWLSALRVDAVAGAVGGSAHT